MENKVLIYKISDQEKENKFKKILDDRSIKYIDIDEKDVFQKVGYLANLDAYVRDDNPLEEDINRDEMVLFVALEESLLIDILKAMKKEQVYIAHKAALTDTTKDWTFNYLVGHIKNENRLVQAYSKMMRDVNGIEKTIEAIDEGMLKLIKEAKEMGRDPNLTLKNIELHHEKILKELSKIRKDNNEDR